MTELSKEQIDKLGFTPTEAEMKYVDNMASVVMGDLETKRRFEGRRNRSAFKRMRRPHMELKREAGSKIIFGLLGKLED